MGWKSKPGTLSIPTILVCVCGSVAWRCTNLSIIADVLSVARRQSGRHWVAGRPTSACTGQRTIKVNLLPHHLYEKEHMVGMRFLPLVQELDSYIIFNRAVGYPTPRADPEGFPWYAGKQFIWCVDIITGKHAWEVTSLQSNKCHWKQ